MVVRVCLLHSERFNVKADKGVGIHSLLGHVQILGMFLVFNFIEDQQEWDFPKCPRNRWSWIPRHKTPGALPIVLF